MPKLISGRSALVDSRGSILQVVKTTKTTAVSTTAPQTYVEIDNLTLTTKGANSSFFVMGSAHAYSNASQSRANIGFQIGSTFIAGKNGTGDTWGHNVGGQGGLINRHIITDQTYAIGTSLTFRLMGATWDANYTNPPTNSIHEPMIFNWGSQVSTPVDYGHETCLTVMEIAN
tara:strand:+ start:131 stop:649 length:519 start_codon:yes stop_codon:yes gene_type:complete